MKVKVTVLVVLAVVIVGLIAAKGNGREKISEEDSEVKTSQAASLIEQAKKQGQPAWLLFHSTT